MDELHEGDLLLRDHAAGKTITLLLGRAEDAYGDLRWRVAQVWTSERAVKTYILYGVGAAFLVQFHRRVQSINDAV